MKTVLVGVLEILPRFRYYGQLTCLWNDFVSVNHESAVLMALCLVCIFGMSCLHHHNFSPETDITCRYAHLKDRALVGPHKHVCDSEYTWLSLLVKSLLSGLLYSSSRNLLLENYGAFRWPLKVDGNRYLNIWRQKHTTLIHTVFSQTPSNVEQEVDVPLV